MGRKFMFDNDFRTAEQYLSYAFEHCHKDSRCMLIQNPLFRTNYTAFAYLRRNKRSILIYLIPVKMLLGHMPKIPVLKK